MNDQSRLNEALLTGQVQINRPRYFFLKAQDLSRYRSLIRIITVV